MGKGISETMVKNTRVCLRIDGVNHHLCKYKNYLGGGKQKQICPKCSLYETHSAYCWSIGTPVCSVLAEANNWENNFEVYFKTIKRK